MLFTSGFLEQNKNQVEKLLRQYGEKGLKPSEDYIEEGINLGQKVFEKLQEKSKRFTIAEVHFAGSIGKKTNVITPDLDLVVVVNNFELPPPFEDVLDDFETILELHRVELKIRKDSIQRKTKFSIQFEFKCGIEVDILPAAYLSFQEVHKMIAKNPDDYYKYSTSLVKRQLEFMTTHPSSFVHVIIRLAKYWYKSLCFGDKYVSGGGTMIELIGVAAAEKEEERSGEEESNSVLRAFADVINMIINIKSLKLAFKEVEIGEKWERVPPNQMNSRALIPNVIGTEEIFKRRSFIVEPANPFNDLLGGNDPEVIDKLVGFAKETRNRLDKLLNMSGEYISFDHNKNLLTMDILKLFEPQPVSLKAAYPQAVHKDILISWATPYKSIYSDLEVRREEVMERKEIKWAVEVLKWQLTAVVNSVVKFGSGQEEGSKGSPFDRIREAGRNQLKKSLDVPGFVDAKQGEKHEDRDMTLTVPYEVDGKIYAVVFSISWKLN